MKILVLPFDSMRQLLSLNRRAVSTSVHFTLDNVHKMQMIDVSCKIWSIYSWSPVSSLT
jgi:hypothetical protein